MQILFFSQTELLNTNNLFQALLLIDVSTVWKSCISKQACQRKSKISNLRFEFV